MDRRQKNADLIHKSFTLGLLIKGIDSVFEIIGGVFFIFLNPTRLNKIVVLLTQHELLEDPRDVIARLIVSLSSKFTISTQYFAAFYLISHGVIKIIIVILLWKRKLWAYPIAIISLVLFIVYQIYRYTIVHSLSMIILSIFDAIMIILTWNEYKNIK